MTIYSRHVLRNALIPIVTNLGLLFADLLTGAVFTEAVFVRPGLGRFAVNAVSARDFPQIQGLVLIIATFYLLMNLFVDVVWRDRSSRALILGCYAVLLPLVITRSPGHGSNE